MFLFPFVLWSTLNKEPDDQTVAVWVGRGVNACPWYCGIMLELDVMELEEDAGVGVEPDADESVDVLVDTVQLFWATGTGTGILL